MTPGDSFFQRALLGSFALHLLLAVGLFLLPSGERGTDLTVYTVRIMEAPPRPAARELSLSTEAISALKLEAPSLSAEPPPVSDLEAPEIPAPGTEAPRSDAMVSRPPEAPANVPSSTAQPSPPERTPPSAELPPSGPPAVGEIQPAPSTQPPPALPSLPERAAPDAPPAASPPAEAPARQVPPAPPALGDTGEPESPSTMERLRQRVERASVEVESEPAAASQPGVTAPERTERSVFALRLFSNRVREAVKENYSFPGGFAPDLRTRVRVVINRDGSIGETKILQSSGNERFDRLACLNAIRQAQLPAIPSEIEGETLALNITCSP